MKPALAPLPISEAQQAMRLKCQQASRLNYPKRPTRGSILKQQRRTLILDQLTNKPQHINDLSDLLNIPAGSMRYVLRELRIEGVIRCIGQQGWVMV